LSLWPVGFAYGIAATMVAARHGELTTYAGTSTALGAAELVAGWALLAGGLLAWGRHPGGVAGAVAVTAGFAWFAPDWVGWQLGPGAVRSAALVAAGLVPALIFHLTLAAPTGRAAPAAARVAVCGLYGVVGALALARLLFYDPFADPDCWRNCVRNAFLVRGGAGVARVLDATEAVVALFASLLLVGLVVARLRAISGPARRAAWPVFAAGACFATAQAAHAIALLRTPLEDPGARPFQLVFAARCAGAVALGLALLWSLWRARAVRSALARLILDLGAAPAPGLLQDVLASVSGDPGLRVAYRRTAGGGYVDAHGVALPADAVDGRGGVTPIVRHGDEVALVLHDDASSVGGDLAGEIGAAARLAVENERLQAEARAQLFELRASRARIVEAGDTARRRLERDLHDGAQQRLVGVALVLRLAQGRLADDPDVRLAGRLAHADEELRLALAELRELAHGLHPAVLTDEGLAAAIDVLVESAPVAVEAQLDLAERVAPALEAAAYRVVAEALENTARHARATHAVVRIARADGQLVVEAADDGTGGADPSRGTGLADLEDRVSALDGRLLIDNPPAGGTRIRAEIPCGS
jgi:signal transduction histidine kinase